MKTICFFFEIHQMFCMKRYRFFDIDYDHYYFDDFANETNIEDVINKSYGPTVDTLLEMIYNSGGQFKFAIGVSGVALELFEMHAPEFIEKLKKLAESKCCEFVAQPYSYGLSSLYDEKGFRNEVKRQSKKIKQLFDVSPAVFANSNLIYSDEIGEIVSSMGYKVVLTEGAKHILGWKSPHYLYGSRHNNSLSVLFRDFKLSDDISLRFNNSTWDEYPLFADKYADWIAALPDEEQVVNIFMDMTAFGIAQPLSSNILEFIKALPACAAQRGISFATPTEIARKMKPVSPVDVPHPISWCDEERDTSSWNGNVMQREALSKLYSVSERVRMSNNKLIKQTWDYLQASDYFHYMSTKNTGIGVNRGIFDSPFDAFTNYMNVIADFIAQVNRLYPEDIDNEQLDSLTQTINNQSLELEEKSKQITELSKKLAECEKLLKKQAIQTTKATNKTQAGEKEK